MLNKSSGQSFLEVILAIALISIVLITIVSLSSLSIRASVYSRQSTEAGRLSQQASEWLKSEKDSDWPIFKSHASASFWWCLDSLYWTNPGPCSPTEIVSGTPFTRTLVLIAHPDGSVEGKIETWWTNAQGLHNVTSSTVYTDWK